MKARIRSIKPEVHTDEDLWDAEQETGLPLFRAFTGLWNWADREGRFEWKPRQLKAGILPYWNDDFSRVLDALVTRGFIVRYTVDGREYGWVRNFAKHQAVNAREEASKLPPPSNTSNVSKDLHASGTRDGREDDASGTRHIPARGEGKGTEGNGRERSTRDGRDSASATTEPSVPEDLRTYCPKDLLTSEIVEQLSKYYSVSSEAIREAEREFKTYWTVGGGAGATNSRGMWLKKCRDSIKRHHDRGELAGLGAKSSTSPDGRPAPASPEAVARKDASRRAFVERRSRELGLTSETAQEGQP